MRGDNDFIFESYITHRKQYILENSIADFYKQNPLDQIYDLYKYDIDCIEELVQEGMMGDMWNSVKGGVQKATKFVANKGIEMLLGLLKKITTPEDLKGIEQLQDPQKLKQYAAKGMQDLNSQPATQQQPQQPTNNESVYANKRFFAATLLAENNLVEMVEKYTFITEQVLQEAKGNKVGATKAGANSSYWNTTSAAKNQKNLATSRKKAEAGRKGQAAAPYGGKAPKAPAAQSIASNTPAADSGLEKKLTAKARDIKGQQQPRGSGKLSKYVKQVADELRKRYSKSPSQLQDGLRSFNQQLNSALGTKASASAKGAPAKGTIGSLPKAPAPQPQGKEQPPTYPKIDSGYPETTGAAAGAAGAAGATAPSAGGTAPSTDAAGVPATNVAAPETKQKEGLIRKAINWVKANPKRTAGTILGIIAVIALAVGGWTVLVPMLAKYGFLAGAAQGAILGGAKSAVQNIASQGFSNNKFSGSELAKKTAKGAAIGGTIGGIAGALGGGNDTPDNGDANYANPEEVQYQQVDKSEVQEPETDTMYPIEEPTPQVDEDEFAKYNVPQKGSPAEQQASQFDAKSPMDQAKKMIMQKLKDANDGQIPASKYNAAAAKVSGLLKKGMKPDQIAAQLVGDSVNYTSGYLDYF